jgi:hypothetical protein
MAKLLREPGYIDRFLNPKHRCKEVSAGTSLRSLRDRELPPEIATRIAPFVAAYLPDPYRDKKESRLRQLQEMGYEPIERDGGFMEDFEELYFETHGYYPDEKDENVQGDSGA